MKTIILITLIASCSAQTLDKKFWAVSAFSASSLAADAYTTSWIKPSRSYCNSEGGEVWLLGTTPSDKRLIGVSLGELALGESLMYFTKRSSNRWIHATWPTWAVWRGGLHTYGAVHNFEVCR